MKLLIVSSTIFEIAPLFNFLKIQPKDKNFFYSTDFFSNVIEILITGIGAVPMTYNLTVRLLIESNYDLVINAGFAGSFKNFENGTVVYVTEEQFGDLGINDNGIFKTLFETNLSSKNDFPFKDGKLYNNLPSTILQKLKNYPAVKGLTINTVSGEQEQIIFFKNKFDADIETMEGAAFFYVMLQRSIPFLELRSISNAVEPRDKNKWAILKAQIKLSEALKFFILDWLIV